MDKFAKERERLLDAMSKHCKPEEIEEIVYPFLNNDVPEFLGRLDEFEEESGKLDRRINVCYSEELLPISKETLKHLQEIKDFEDWSRKTGGDLEACSCERDSRAA